MDLVVSGLHIPVETDTVDEYVRAAALTLGCDADAVSCIAILAKSLDASDPEQFYYTVSIAARINGQFDNPGKLPAYVAPVPVVRRPAAMKGRPVVVGFGPAGMFAALELVAHGLKPVVFERGKKIEERSRDVERFIVDRALDPESNIQFGEGGAGSYSDGKLFSRVNNSGYVSRVLETFVRFGAPEEIRYVSKPHVGTDVLCRIVRNIRDHVLAHGGEIHYGSRMTDILVSGGKAAGVVINGEKEYPAPSVYLAVGHSARDTFELLHRKGIALEQRPISVGLRVEHPAEIINLIRYGEKYKDGAGIGAATYSFTYTDRQVGRGVYTFCMCPGGEVVNASSADGMLVVNGMSNAARSSAFSNAAMVVTCHAADYGSDHPLAGVEFQKAIERRAFDAGGGNWKVPAQNLTDFLAGRESRELNESSFRMGMAAADLRAVFPDFVTGELVAAFNSWKEGYPLFVSDHALLLGAETRTTCPVRVVRSESCESVSLKNLYPIGEGAGHAGGITSSAADAVKAVEANLNSLK